MTPPTARAFLACLLLLAPVAQTAQGEEGFDGAAAIAWLAQTQHDGRFDLAPYVTEAVASAGQDPKAWPSPASALWASLEPYGLSTQDVEYSYLRLAYAAASAGYDPRDVNGRDLVQLVRSLYRDGQFGSPSYVNDDAWAILALRAAGVPASDEQIVAARTELLGGRAADGGWAYTRSAPVSDSDVTGMALVALRAAGESIEGDVRARLFLDSTRRDGGGHSSGPGLGGTPNCQSTVWALHGYAALGVAWRADTQAWLTALQNADGGFRTTPTYPPSDLFCTAEATTLLTGGVHPLPRYRSPTIDLPAVHALENGTLRVESPFHSATWTFGDETIGGTSVTRRFDVAGSHPFRLLAEGPGVRARAEGEVVVLSARPILGALPENISLFRHAPLALDLAGASDPDGRIARIVVDWGDGNLTDADARTFEHAYALPGERTLVVRAVDDAGVESLPARIAVRVQNRAPLAPALPEHLLADRVTGVALDLAPADPEGDAVDVAWTFGALSGAGAPAFVPTTLGNHTLALTLRDAFGATTNASLLVQVVNLPPEITTFTTNLSGAWATLAAEAVDPDGGEPMVVWDVGGARVSSWTARVRLDPGETVVRAIATDADGATSERATTLRVEPAGEPARAPPEIHALDARLEEGALVVTFDATSGARATLAWTSDAGDGEREATSPARIALPDATQASVRLTVELDGLATMRESGLLVAPREVPAPTPALPPPAEPVVVAAVAEPSPRVDPRPEPDALGSASLTPQPRQQTPAPAWLALAAVALLAMRGRRAR